jgi:hypothetical protein
MSDTINQKDRRLILLGLGSPETDNAHDALGCAISALDAEAEMLAQGENLGPNTTALEYAHNARLEALNHLVDDYMTVSWPETAEERAAARPAGKQGLRVVPTRGEK